MADIRLRRAGYSLFDDEELITSRNLTLSLLDYAYLTEAAGKAWSKPLSAGALAADVRVMRPYLVPTDGAQVTDVAYNVVGQTLSAGAQVADVFDPLTQWVRDFSEGVPATEARAMHVDRPDAAGAQVGDTRYSTYAKPCADGAIAADVFDRVVQWQRAYTESPAVSESMLRVMLWVRVLTAVVEAADARVVNGGKNITDYAPIVETYARAIGFPLTAAAITDAAFAAHPGKPLAAGVEIADVLEPGFVLALLETLLAAETHAGAAGHTITDVAAILEALAQAAAKVLTAGGVVGEQRAAHPGKVTTDGVEIADVIFPAWALWLLETLPATAALTWWDRQRLTDTSAITDTYARAVSHPLTATVTVEEALSNAIARALADGAQIADILNVMRALLLSDGVGVSDAGGAAYAVLDTFNRADELLIDSPNWARLYVSCTVFPFCDIWVLSNAAQPSSLDTPNDVYWTPAIGNNHETGLIYLASDRLLTDSVSLWGRVANPGTAMLTSYQAYIYFTENPLNLNEAWVGIYRWDDCSTSTLLSDSLLTLLPNDTLRFRVNGAALSVIHNGAAILTATDATYASGSRVGFGIYGANTRVDDFGAGAFSGSAVVMHVFKTLLAGAGIPDTLTEALALFLTDGAEVSDVFQRLAAQLILTLWARSQAMTVGSRDTSLNVWERWLSLNLPKVRTQ